MDLSNIDTEMSTGYQIDATKIFMTANDFVYITVQNDLRDYIQWVLYQYMLRHEGTDRRNFVCLPSLVLFTNMD